MAPPQEPLPDRLFYDAFRASPIGIALEDLTGRLAFVNPALCAMLGFSEEEMRQKHCVDVSPPEDAEKDWALFQQIRAGAIDRYSLDKRYLRKDGTVMWGRVSIALLKNPASHLVIAMVEDITDQRHAQDQLQHSQASLQKLSGRLIEAQEQERLHLAREIHDDISQTLAVVANELEAIARRPRGADPELQSHLARALAHLSETTQALHALSHRLHSSKLDILIPVPT